MGIGFHAFVILAAPVTGLLVWLIAQGLGLPMPIAPALGAGAAGLIILSVRIASQWQVAVVMRFGKFQGLKGPGLFFLVPVVDSISYWIDLRTVASPFRAEQTLTGDSVPVDVDEVLFWRVVDPQKAALNVIDYVEAISWAAQTALRDVIGETDLAVMMVGRRKIGPKLQKLISAKAEDWGIEVISVELRDVRIPADLQDAMSKQAQAERELEARVTLAEAEHQAAKKFKEASAIYELSPTALHLRGMNMMLEGMKNNSTIVVVPSPAIETMGLGTILGLASAANPDGNPGVSDAEKIELPREPDASLEPTD